ncbi:hypothetical protein HK100_009253 [Physocladia obscura]|uniref:pyridoxal 5'-phosphate synthase n=1 Tax=Physocladia obscura TaxID=109957 RepID=A0AAD5T3H4_9FUNG|nr:hypothetical protein HK100_009253 [Physocladia obscura]
MDKQLEPLAQRVSDIATQPDESPETPNIMMDLFNAWINDAHTRLGPTQLARAMVVTTTKPSTRPSAAIVKPYTSTNSVAPTARIVMQRRTPPSYHDPNVFTFTTCAYSDKAVQLQANKQIALSFNLGAGVFPNTSINTATTTTTTHRSISVEGIAELADAASTSALFANRTRWAQVGEWVSEHMSQRLPVNDFASLDAAEARRAAIELYYSDATPNALSTSSVPQPPWFHAFFVQPERVVFVERHSRFVERQIFTHIYDSDSNSLASKWVVNESIIVSDEAD